jgi:hypothetical protein
MRVFLLLGTSALAALSGCAILYSYDDYQDGRGDSGASGTTSSGGACTEASQCPGEDTECSSRTCESGVCKIDQTPGGTEAATQTEADCKVRVCDSEGSAVDQPDDGDTPDDDNDCTTDTCEDGTPGRDFVDRGTRCGEGAETRCDGQGHCVGCTGQRDCPASQGCIGWTCEEGTCTSTTAPAGTPCGETSCQDQLLSSSTCDNNGLCMQRQQDCTPYLCSNSACGTSCSATDECLPGNNCDNGACRDCVTCGEWLEAPGPLEGSRVCESSIEIFRRMQGCACNDTCAARCGDNCPRVAFNNDCAACVQESCPEAYAFCAGDR